MLKKNAWLLDIRENTHNVSWKYGVWNNEVCVYYWDIDSKKEVKLIRVHWYREFCSHIAMKWKVT